jgi:hypothetical protein
MHRKVAFIDNQTMALEFNSGDVVQRGGLHDFFLTPYLGRVLSSNPETGRVQVQWPWGVEQETPTELIRVNMENSMYYPVNIDQSYSSLDQAWNTNDPDTLKAESKWRKALASRAVARYEEKTLPIWREACRSWHSGENQIKAYSRLSALFAGEFGHEPVRLTISNLYETGSRLAIYWKSTKRRYKVTNREKSSGQLSCPRCKSYLKPRVYRHGQKMLQCRTCGFSIHPDDLVHPGEEAAPDVEVNINYDSGY